MNQELVWSPLTRVDVMRRLKEAGSDKSILALRRDGKGYFGRVNDVNDHYVELVNGDHRQNLYYVGSPTLFAVIDEPPAPTYKLADRRLKLEN